MYENNDLSEDHSTSTREDSNNLAERKPARKDLPDVAFLLVYRTAQEVLMMVQWSLSKEPIDQGGAFLREKELVIRTIPLQRERSATTWLKENLRGKTDQMWPLFWCIGQLRRA